MRVVVTGGREFNDIDMVREALSPLPKDAVVINGGCTGADQLCAEVAEELGLHVRTFKANWRRYGKKAGPKGNWQMLQGADLLIAFPGGRGTANCISQAHACGVNVRYAGENATRKDHPVKANANVIKRYDPEVMKKRLTEVQKAYPDNAELLSRIGRKIREAKAKAGAPGTIDSNCINGWLASAAFSAKEPEQSIYLDIMHAVYDAIDSAEGEQDDM